MDKEEILKKSREENEDQDGEYEESVLAQAYKISICVGSVLCVLLIIATRYWSDIAEVAFGGLLLLFTVTGSSDLTMFVKLKEKKYLFHAFPDIFLVGIMVYIWMTSSH